MAEQKKTDEWEKQESSGFWKPEEKGEELVGKVRSIGEGTYGTKYTIEQENGETVILPAYKVLLARLENVKVDDMVKIVYKGDEAPKIKGWKPTKLFDVYVKKQG